jgi:serine/threonine protein phosphatase PrpC
LFFLKSLSSDKSKTEETSTKDTENNNNNNLNNSNQNSNKADESEKPVFKADSDNNNSSSSSTDTQAWNTFRKSSQWPDYTEALEKKLRETIRKGHLNLDDKIRSTAEFDRGEDKSGSTAISCFITPSHIYLINCGDSRAIMVRDNQIALSTYDHKPMNPTERDRIQKAGGSVMIQRVNGSLAVSRALGDFEYKNVEGKGACEQLVSPEPEIYIIDRDNSKDEFIVLACDGIWDVMSNEELKNFIRARMRVTNDLVKISNEVLDLCLNKVKQFDTIYLMIFEKKNYSFIQFFFFNRAVEIT